MTAAKHSLRYLTGSPKLCVAYKSKKIRLHGGTNPEETLLRCNGDKALPVRRGVGAVRESVYALWHVLNCQSAHEGMLDTSTGACGLSQACSQVPSGTPRPVHYLH